MRKNQKCAIGNSIVIIRERLGYSQEQLAKILKVTRCTIWNWENLLSKVPYSAIISLRAIIDYHKQDNPDLASLDAYWPTMKDIMEEEE